MKSKYAIDLFDENDIKKSQSYIPEEANHYKTETAGFVPLEVKLKQFEQNGLVAKFQSEDFTSNDYRELYLNHPDFDITPEDDFEEAMEKLEALKAYKEEYKKTLANSERIGKSPSVSAAAGKEEEQITEPKEELVE